MRPRCSRFVIQCRERAGKIVQRHRDKPQHHHPADPAEQRGSECDKRCRRGLNLGGFIRCVHFLRLPFKIAAHDLHRAEHIFRYIKLAAILAVQGAGVNKALRHLAVAGRYILKPFPSYHVVFASFLNIISPGGTAYAAAYRLADIVRVLDYPARGVGRIVELALAVDACAGRVADLVKLLLAYAVDRAIGRDRVDLVKTAARISCARDFLTRRTRRSRGRRRRLCGCRRERPRPRRWTRARARTWRSSRRRSLFHLKAVSLERRLARSGDLPALKSLVRAAVSIRIAQLIRG